VEVFEDLLGTDIRTWDALRGGGSLLLGSLRRMGRIMRIPGGVRLLMREAGSAWGKGSAGGVRGAEEGGGFGAVGDLFGDLVQGEVTIIRGEAHGVVREGGEYVVGGFGTEVPGEGAEAGAEGVLEDALAQEGFWS